jgi:predicted RNA-binding Zn-ribbon protein involved in translation (DUF1610 family)
MPGCGKCGAKLDVMFNQVGRRDVCPECGSELHACIHCRHYDETVAKECKEPFAEVPEDKESANFCDFYQIGDGTQRQGASMREAQFNAAEALFRKSPGS